MHLHIVGICGTFMGGIAALARAAGHRVTGSDRAVYPPMSTQLAALGIDVIEGYAPDQLALSPDVFVIGNVMSRSPPSSTVPTRASEACSRSPNCPAPRDPRQRPRSAVGKSSKYLAKVFMPPEA